MDKRKHAAFDWARIIMALLVVAIHTSPFASIDRTVDFILTRIFARVAVPFFFMLTGYFTIGDIPKTARVIGFLKKTLLLYAAAIALYLPLNFYTGYFEKNTALSVLRDVLFSGTAYHLWYFPAVLLGVIIVVVLKKHLPDALVWIICGALYIIGLFGDSYYGILSGIGWINVFFQTVISIFAYTRNGLFFAPLFLFMGSAMRGKKQLSIRRDIAGLLLSLALVVVEGLVLRHRSLQLHDSMYAVLPFLTLFLFNMLRARNRANHPVVRDVATCIYILHPAVIIVVRGVAKYLSLESVLIQNSMVFFITVTLCSIAASVIAAFLISKVKSQPALPRLWAEIDFGNLTHNVRAIQAVLPAQTEFMAVVKANAYGHGDILVARHLNSIGIKSFAVASLEEGIHLRKNRIKGLILILGYTAPENSRLLKRFGLTQTVCDYNHAVALHRQGVRLDVHVKIDTGMHRLGESSDDVDRLAEIYRMQNLRVTGTFSHLAAAELLGESAKQLTEEQIERFDQVVAAIKDRGLDPGKTHIQSSYGVVNYPHLRYDCARVGILMYGVDSCATTHYCQQLQLKPVLSLKARIAAIKRVAKGECIGYGIDYRCAQDRTIAVIPIGYADGLPRCYGELGGKLIVNGHLAPVLGRVCMDQVIADVSGTPQVSPNSIVTWIGQDQGSDISCEKVAAICNTISNEVLSCLGPRIERIAAENS